MVKGVFFDLGGTLFGYGKAELTMTMLQELAKRLDIGAVPQKLVGKYQRACKDADAYFAEKPFYLFRDYFGAIFSNLIAQWARPLNPDDLAWYIDFHCITKVNSLELRHDCQTVLNALKSRNLYLSVVSNIDENMLHPLIDRARLDRWLNHWISSEAARACKPHPRVFEIALEKSGLSPGDVIFVGDSLEQDIQGAHDVGMKTVLISEDGREAPMHVGKKTVEPDFRITELSMLIDIVDNH